MKKCCEVTCNKPVMENSQVGACEEHEEEIIEMYEEEYKAYQKELYEEWSAEVTRDCNRTIREYYAHKRSVGE